MSTPRDAHQTDRKLDAVVGSLRTRLPELRRRYGVVRLGVFDSYVQNQARDDSDLDVLVEFDNRELSLFEFVALREELSDLLGVDVDLVEKKALKPRIGERILQDVVYL